MRGKGGAVRLVAVNPSEFLVIGVMILNPPLQAPAFSQYVSGGGPVIPGPMFPFVTVVECPQAEMLAKIEGYLNESRERHFIAVGALHLAGPRGLVEQLKKRGYVVKQL